MSCIGTAGHVDHGKSTLVQALTGIDPDRLAEEKERGMTIDLGFAWLTLPGGREVSIVDVPGHESFIKNMLAGVGGIDAALLVVAADEGVMPQTREHLAILDLLRIPRGVVALTKADLVDEEWLELVRADVAELLQSTLLADAAIIPVSAYTRQGLPALLAEFERLLNTSLERPHIARPRLPIDRVFSLTGFGTVVTGTLLDGTFKVGQEVELLPQGSKARIRSLQMHKHQIELAQPGTRVALNLPNVPRSALVRGNVVCLPGQLRTTMLFDARIQLLAAAEHPLTHNMQVDFYAGSQEISARVRLLDTDELLPGHSAWVQLRLSQPAVVARRDRFILRIPSPSMTIGGGEVVDVQPRYHRRFQQPLLAHLEHIAQGSPEELVLAALDRRRVSSPTIELNAYAVADIAKKSNLALAETSQVLETLQAEGRVRNVADFWFAQHIWDALLAETIRLLREQHRLYPLRSGLPKEEWRTRLHLSPKLATETFQILQAEGHLQAVAGLIRLPDFVPTFSPMQQQQIERLLKHFQANPYAPPGRSEVEASVGPEVLNALVEQGRIVKLADGVLFLRTDYAAAVLKLVAYLRAHGSITVAEARDVLGTTRKYILPLLEHMDALHITRRRGDERNLGANASASDELLL